ncbi:MAG: polymer-forming cytoskeletal protein [bacterium]|nr:polymer-forming cytoskeletal protein [bacterium]
MEDGIVKDGKTTINHSTIIEGNIKAQEHLIINGTINGNVEIKGYNLFVGPSGRIDGEVHAQDVRIRGDMRGDIKATGKVEITTEANFSGKIKSKSISVEQGAYFDASVELGGGLSGTKAQKGTSAEKSTTQLS